MLIYRSNITHMTVAIWVKLISHIITIFYYDISDLLHAYICNILIKNGAKENILWIFIYLLKVGAIYVILIYRLYEKVLY